jgi:hypothetical protein
LTKQRFSTYPFDKIIDVLGVDRYGQQIAAAWIAKEKLCEPVDDRYRVKVVPINR